MPRLLASLCKFNETMRAEKKQRGFPAISLKGCPLTQLFGGNMKTKIMVAAISSLCLFNHIALAKHASFSVNIPGTDDSITIREGGKHHRGLEWVASRTGAPLPRHAVVGGGQPQPPATLYVCHAQFRGGVHPGKLYEGRCNIGWGGQEFSLTRYEVLTSRRSLNWVPANYGAIPPGAIQGGYQQNGALFICQADYMGGRHTGKVVGQNCNFGWGGREVTIPYYQVLVR